MDKPAVLACEDTRKWVVKALQRARHHWGEAPHMRGGGDHFLAAFQGMVAPPSLPLLSLLRSHCQLRQLRGNGRSENTSNNQQNPPHGLGRGQPCWREVATGAGCSHLRLRWERQGCKRGWDLVWLTRKVQCSHALKKWLYKHPLGSGPLKFMWSQGKKWNRNSCWGPASQEISHVPPWVGYAVQKYPRILCWACPQKEIYGI